MHGVGGKTQNFNLESTSIAIFDGDAVSMAITTQILAGFGAKHIHRCDSESLATRTVLASDLDLVMVDPTLTGDAGYEFIRWLRRNGGERNRFAPVLVVSAQTQAARIGHARDCGANFVVSKPLTPAKLMQRILWITRDQRAYVECAAYVGPERRFKFVGPPPGTEGRRAEDLKGELGEAMQPNMSQADIDNLMQPRRVNL